jgi:DNA repair exonuclease SbcCD ATPase subunit
MASGASSRLGRPIRGNDDDEEEEILAGADHPQHGQDLKDAKDALVKATREAEQAKLELLEASTDLKDEKRKVSSLQHEVQELKRKAADSRVDEASALDQRQIETDKYTAEVNKLRKALEQASNDLAVATTSRSDLESEVHQLREDLSKFTASGDAAVVEKKQLMDTVESLKVAGRSLTQIYEERLMNSEAARQEVEDHLQATREELDYARQQLERAQNDTEALRQSTSLQPSSTDAILAASLSAGMQTEQKESAVLIDNENLKAELQHTRDRLSHLEEQMDDVRAELEAEVEKEKKKRQESVEIGEKLKREMSSLKDMVKQAKSEKDKAGQRANELQVALDENQATLEKERAELESLRNESSTRPTSAQGTVKEEVSSHSQQLALSKAQKEASDRASEIVRLKEELEDLKEELKLAEETRDESSKLADVSRSESNGALHTRDLQARHQAEVASKDEEIRELTRRLALRSSSSAMTVSTEPPTNDSSPISAQSYPYLSPSAVHGRESPSATSVSPDASPSLRIKRESSSSSIRRFKDEQATLRDEIEGLKFLLKQANEERDSYADQNRRLIEEAQTLR